MVGLATNLLQVVLTYGFALLEWSYWSLIVPSILSAAITLLCYSRKTRIGWAWPKRQAISMTLLRSKSLILNVSGYRLLVYCVRNVDNFVVSKIFGLNLLGLYSRAFNMASLPVQIITGVSNDIQYSMLAELKKEGSERVKDEFAHFLRVLGIIGFPVVLVFQLWSHEFSRIVWGWRWEEVGTYLEPLSILIPTNLILYSVSSIFLLERQEKLLFKNSIVSAFGIIAGVVVGSFFSLKGVIIGLLVGNLLFTIPITGYNVLHRIMDFSWNQILRIWGINWIIALGLTISYLFAQYYLKILFITFYGGVFAVRGYNYYRLHLMKSK
jgi:PST family polysaccharide transporter